MAGADSNENGNEFPAVCSDCIGPDKHIKMIRQPQGNECRICTRPFTVFIWNPSDNVRKSKKTIICSTCSRARNCCQSCMRDINFRIPLEIRDTALKMAGLDKAYSFTSKSLESTNREVKAIMADKQEANFNQDSEQDQQEQAREILTKLSERLTERSVKPKSDRSSEKKHEDIKGVDISKILSKLPFAGLIEIPEDKTITSFFVFGLTDDFPQWAITNYCNQFGKLRNMTIIHRAKCGYVGFITRDAAESFSKAIIANGLNENKATPGVLVLENRFPIRVSWGKPRSLGTTNPEQYKIGLVVQKVMRHLAEKDKDHLTGKSSQPNKSLKKKQPSKIKPLEKQADKRQLDKPKYKALSEDFEI